MKLVEGYKAGYCAVCGTQIENYEGNKINDNCIYYGFTCHNCGYYGEEIYKLNYECTSCVMTDDVDVFD